MVAVFTTEPPPAPSSSPALYEVEPPPDILAGYLPGVLRQDALLVRLLKVFDGILRPLLDAISAADCYIDPGLAPAAMLDWLSGWVGVSVGGSIPEETRRV